MGSEKSKTHYQGLLIEDSRVQIWKEETTAQSAGPRPGVPKPLNQTGMTLQSSGSQAASKSMSIRTQRGGFAEPNGAGFVFRESESEDWRGYDIPATISHYEPLKWSDLSVPITWYVQPHAITLKNHTVLSAYYERDDSEAKPFAVTVAKRVGTTWSHVRVAETAAQPTVAVCEFHPCLLLLPSGRILLMHWIQDQSRNVAQIRSWFSDDDGETWAIMQDNVLSEPVSLDAGASGYAVRRFRVAYGAGQILMLCHLRSNNSSLAAQDVVRQYASADLGNSYDVITEWDGDANAGGWPDIEYIGGHFLCGYIQSEPIEQGLCTFLKLGSAYSNSSTVEHVELDFAPAFGDFDVTSSRFIVDGDLALASTSDGALYVSGRAVNSATFSAYEENSACFIYRSDDFGESWQPVGQFSGFGGLSGLVGVWYNANASTTCPTAFTMTECEGRLAVVTNWKATPGAVPSLPTEPSLSVIYLGGSTNVTLPGYQRFQTSYRRVNFEDTWLPFDLPQVTPTRWASGWNSLGAGSEQLVDGCLLLNSSAPGERFYVSSGLPSGATANHGAILSFSCELVSGGSPVSNDVAVRVKMDDGSNSYVAVIRVDSSGVYVCEDSTGVTLGFVNVTGNTPGVDVIFAQKSGQFSVWARARTSKSDRFFEPPVSGHIPPTLPGGGAAVVWGNLSPSSSVSKWYSFQMVTGLYTGLHLAEGVDNPADLMPHAFSITSTFVKDDLSVRATDGTTIRADEFEIKTRYDFDVENVLDSNPRKVWRSTDTSAQSIALKLNDLGNASMQSDLIGLSLFNCNFAEATLEAFDSASSSWISLCQINMTSGLAALAFSRDGDSVEPSGFIIDEPLIYAGEFEGAAFSYNGAVARKIKSHLTGKWSTSNTKRSEVILDDVDASDPASGTGSISSKNGSFLVSLKGQKYQGFRLSIKAPGGAVPANADDYFEIGRLLFGPVIVHSDSTGWGRTIETSAGVELLEARDRTTRSRKIAPSRRIIEYGFTDGVDTSKGMNPQGDADPDFAKADSDAAADAVALNHVAPWDFDGVFHLVSGSFSQVVYLPRISFQNGQPVESLVRKHQHALCRITSPARLESVQGEELDDEVLRVATITLTEDV